MYIVKIRNKGLFINLIIGIFFISGCDLNRKPASAKSVKKINPLSRKNSSTHEDLSTLIVSEKNLKAKLHQLKQEFDFLKLRYKQADQRYKAELKSRLLEIKKDGENIKIQLKAIHAKQTAIYRRNYKNKLIALQNELAFKEKEYHELRVWDKKLVNMSNVTSHNVCAWCGCSFSRTTATRLSCPHCGKTVILPPTEDGVSDVQRERKSVARKLTKLNAEIRGLKISISRYKMLIKHAG